MNYPPKEREPYKMVPTITDLRGRIWEMFTDESYYGMICVRCVSDTQFNSDTSFHFMNSNDAEKFLNLLEKAR